MRTGNSIRRDKQGGLAMVEFAIVLPLLLLIMLGTAELGRAFYQYNTLTKAVRDGARYLADNSFAGGTTGVIDISGEQANTQNLVVYGNRAGNGEPLLPGLATDAIAVTQFDPFHIRVAASYTYISILGVPIPSFGYSDGGIQTDFTFNAQSTMRALR